MTASRTVGTRVSRLRFSDAVFAGMLIGMTPVILLWILTEGWILETGYATVGGVLGAFSVWSMLRAIERRALAARS